MGIDPVTLAMVSIGANVVGGLMSAGGQINKGASEGAAYDYQAQVARNNEIVANQAADLAVASGNRNAQIRYGQGSQALEQDKANYAAGNLDVTGGTPHDVLSTVKAMTDFDVMTIRSDAARTAWNYRNQGVGYNAQANLDTMAGQRSRTAGTAAGMGSLLSAGGAVADKWNTYTTMTGNVGAGVPSVGGPIDAGIMAMSMA